MAFVSWTANHCPVGKTHAPAQARICITPLRHPRGASPWSHLSSLPAITACAQPDIPHSILWFPQHTAISDLPAFAPGSLSTRKAFLLFLPGERSVSSKMQGVTSPIKLSCSPPPRGNPLSPMYAHFMNNCTMLSAVFHNVHESLCPCGSHEGQDHIVSASTETDSRSWQTAHAQ